MQPLFRLAREAVSAWIDDYAPSMGAALAYYTLFSLAPLLIIVTAAAGFFFGRDAIEGAIVGQLAVLVGEQPAAALQALVASASSSDAGGAASILSVAMLVAGATTVFAELQSALDRIWRVPEQRKVSGLWTLVSSRLVSFGMIFAVGLLLLASLVASAAIAALGKWWGALFGGREVVLQSLNAVISIGLATGLFAAIYKVMPHARIAWRDVWIGAAVTAVLFEAGKFLIGLYLGKIGVASAFGAASSIALLLVWVCYSAQVFLLGAEFTWLYARTQGSHAAMITENAERNKNELEFER
jgi:membrane protein